MKHGTFATVALTISAVLLGGCDSTTEPIEGVQALGIVEWLGTPGSEGAGDAGDDVLGRIIVPDTVTAGESFTAALVTLGPSPCWERDGVEVDISDNRIEVSVWDRDPDPSRVCLTVLTELVGDVELSFPNPGVGTIVLTGRRVSEVEEAKDPAGGDARVIEITVVVE